MKKQVHPGVVAAFVVVALGLIAVLFYKGTATPPPQPMSAQGPLAHMMKTSPGAGRVSPDVLEAQKMQQQGNQPSK